MARITTYYGITEPVPFLDVDIEVDNRLFLDPRAIRLQRAPEPFSSAANRATKTFIDEIGRCALSSSRGDRRHGLDLLQHFAEPWETRLGLASGGFRGHGGAEDVGSWIWGSLTTELEALARIGILHQLEDLPLFVKGIDRDLTSDVTTRIVFGPLADFTAQVVASFPEFRTQPHHVEVVTRQIWDQSRLKWASKAVELPVAGGKPLLLVPRNWARSSLLMSAGRFYETSLLSYAQAEQEVLISDGRVLKTPKEVLKRHAGLTRGRDTNLKVTVRASQQGDDLVRSFKQFVDSRYEPLSDEQIGRKVGNQGPQDAVYAI